MFLHNCHSAHGHLDILQLIAIASCLMCLILQRGEKARSYISNLFLSERIDIGTNGARGVLLLSWSLFIQETVLNVLNFNKGN